MFFWFIVFCVIALLAYVRFAPSDEARWHVPIQAAQEKDLTGGAMRIAPCDMPTLDAVAQKSGAKVLAGSADEGHVTYINRSRLIGFPDYTTVQNVDGKTAIYGRLRFGRSDLSVNKKRIEGWLSQL